AAGTPTRSDKHVGALAELHCLVDHFVPAGERENVVERLTRAGCNALEFAQELGTCARRRFEKTPGPATNFRTIKVKVLFEKALVELDGTANGRANLLAVLKA